MNILNRKFYLIHFFIFLFLIVNSYCSFDSNGNLNSTGTITAVEFIGDGSQLTGISSGVEATNPVFYDLFRSTGTYNAGETLAVSGARCEMMWYPRKAAFRAGRINSSQWDNGNIGVYSFATGINTTASGAYSTAIGYDTISSGNYSMSTGYDTTASGDYSTAMSYRGTASGLYSMSTGYSTTASATGSTAMGRNTTASNNYSTALGYYSTASGQFSTAMGSYTTASNSYSTAMGLRSNAIADFSTAMGYFSTAPSYAALAIGKYNVIEGNTTTWVDTDPLFVIGNGANSSNPSNALTVLKNGNTDIDGEVTVNSFVNEGVMLETALALTSATTITTSNYAKYIGCDTTTTDFSITLDSDLVALASNTETFSIIIKDEGANAGTNNITIETEGTEKIDGEDTAIISADYGAVKIYTNGTNWFII